MVHASLLKQFVLYGFPLSSTALSVSGNRRTGLTVKRQTSLVSALFGFCFSRSSKASDLLLYFENLADQWTAWGSIRRYSGYYGHNGHYRHNRHNRYYRPDWYYKPRRYCSPIWWNHWYIDGEHRRVARHYWNTSSWILSHFIDWNFTCRCPCHRPNNQRINWKYCPPSWKLRKHTPWRIIWKWRSSV
jgi:hypothetical protein